MVQEATFKEKFTSIKPFLIEVLETVKKDLRNEHLKSDLQFCKKYFPGKTPIKLPVSELVEGYAAEIITEGKEDLGEFIVNRWLLKKGDIYQFFSEELARINPKFDQITSIESKIAQEIIQKAIPEFGALDTYLFSVFNSVVFPQEIFTELSSLAKKEKADYAIEQKKAEEKMTLDKAIRNHELEMARTVDKYEKKLAGLQKKYQTDIESLKKQISVLQRKCNASAATI